jgi:hypothetical protein
MLAKEKYDSWGGQLVTFFMYKYKYICIIIIKKGGRIKGEEKTPRTSKSTSQRRNPQGPGKGLEEAKNRSVPRPAGRRVWEGLQSANQGVLNHRRDHQNHQSQQGLG